MSAARGLALAVIAVLIAGVSAVGIHVWQSGYRLYIVHTGSMMPTLNPGDVVIDGPAQRSYHRGEIITFRHSDLTTDVVTHRVISTKGGLIQTKGDANRTADTWNIRPDQVRGVAAKMLPKLGYVIVYLKQPAGIASVMTGFLGVILLWGMFFPGATPEADPYPREEVPEESTPIAPTGAVARLRRGAQSAHV